MWGIEFKEANASVISAEVTMKVRQEGGRFLTYKVLFNPYSRTILLKGSGGKFEVVKSNATHEDIEAILPKHFGFEWDYQSFQVAMLAFAECYEKYQILKDALEYT